MILDILIMVIITLVMLVTIAMAMAVSMIVGAAMTTMVMVMIVVILAILVMDVAIMAMEFPELCHLRTLLVAIMITWFALFVTRQSLIQLTALVDPFFHWVWALDVALKVSLRAVCVALHGILHLPGQLRALRQGALFVTLNASSLLKAGLMAFHDRVELLAFLL